jgi:hypothetical protein
LPDFIKCQRIPNHRPLQVDTKVAYQIFSAPNDERSQVGGIRMNLAGDPKDKAELPAALNEFFYRSKTCPVQIEISCE